jgi:hypothetical protein
MTEGGPLQATYSVLYFMFEEGFKWWSLGRASAVAFLLFILMFAVTVVQLRLGRERGGARDAGRARYWSTLCSSSGQCSSRFRCCG